MGYREVRFRPATGPRHFHKGNAAAHSGSRLDAAWVLSETLRRKRKQYWESSPNRRSRFSFAMMGPRVRVLYRITRGNRGDSFTGLERNIGHTLGCRATPIATSMHGMPRDAPGTARRAPKRRTAGAHQFVSRCKAGNAGGGNWCGTGVAVRPARRSRPRPARCMERLHGHGFRKG